MSILPSLVTFCAALAGHGPLAPSSFSVAHQPQDHGHGEQHDHQHPQWTQAELERASAEISREIEAMRGQTFERPVAVAVATPADFEAYMEEMEAALVPPDYSDASEVVAKMLALLPADFDSEAAAKKMLEGLVGGFYDPFSKTFYLSSILQEGAERPILAHELVHALDDQLYDLMGGLRSTVSTHQDAFQAYRAVAEGSAQNLASKWTVEHMDEIDLSVLTEIQNDSLAGLEGVPTALWSPMVWAYSGGADFLVKQTGGAGQIQFAPPGDIDIAFRSPPRSTEQVLHPEKYWDPEQLDEPIPVELNIGELPSGWSLRLQDTVGELSLALVTLPSESRDAPVTSAMQLAAPPATHAVAAGWGGDRVALLESEDGERVLFLATIWDTERDASEFYGAMCALEGQFTDNLLQFMEPGARESSVGCELRYGEHPRTVLVTLHHGPSRSTLRKITRAIEPSFGE